MSDNKRYVYDRDIGGVFQERIYDEVQEIKESVGSSVIRDIGNSTYPSTTLSDMYKVPYRQVCLIRNCFKRQ